MNWGIEEIVCEGGGGGREAVRRSEKMRGRERQNQSEGRSDSLR